MKRLFAVCCLLSVWHVAQPDAQTLSVEQMVLIRSLSSLNEVSALPTSIPMLVTALEDVHHDVRRAGIIALSRIALRLPIVRAQLQQDVQASNFLLQALCRSLTDADYGIRATAVSLITGMFSPLSPDVELKVVQQLQVENEAAVKRSLLHALVHPGPSNPALRAAVGAALSDAEPKVREKAAMVVASRPNSAWLPLVVSGLQNASTETQAAFVLALQSYGALALPHVGLLKAMLSSEQIPSQQTLLLKAIRAIGGQ